MMIVDYFSGLFQGSPKTTTNKPKSDGNIESYSSLGVKTRQQISYHFLNGTHIPSMVQLEQKAIGKGLNIQSRTKNKKIDDAFENLIKEHAKKKNFEITKEMTRDDALKMCISEKVRKGGILVRHYYSNAWDIPYRVGLIGVDMIDVSKYDKSKNICNGLRKDKWGAVVGYFIFTDDTKMKSTEIPASEISKYMDKWIDVSQYTAVSRLSQILPELDDIIQYQKKELEAAEERTGSSVFWHTKLYDTVLDSLRKLYDTMKSTRQFGSDANTNQEFFAEQTQINRDIMKKMANDGLTPGGNIKPIPMDDKITALKNETASIFEQFTKNSLDKISSSQGWSSASVLQDYIKTNWATIDALDGKEEYSHDTEIVKIKDHILEDYLERLFKIGVETGKIKVSLEEYYNNPSEFYKWKVLRQSASILDERKKQNANKIGLEIGAKTLNNIFEKEGLDYQEETLKQVQADIDLELKKKKMYEDAGLEYPNQNKGEEEMTERERGNA